MSRELKIPCQDTELQKQSAKMNTKDKHRETCMYTSFFKRESRTNSTLLINRISKAISENKHGGETEGNIFTSFFKREPQGKYKSALKFTKGIRLTQNNFAAWMIG